MSGYSLGDIADGLGLSRQAAFPSAYYGIGGAPASGPVSFADFYGRSPTPPPAASSFTPDGGTVTNEEFQTASATLSCNNPATWTYTGGGPNAGVNLGSGASATSIIFSVQAPGKPNVSATWNVTGVSNGVSRSFVVKLTADGSLGA